MIAGCQGPGDFSVRDKLITIADEYEKMVCENVHLRQIVEKVRLHESHSPPSKHYQGNGLSHEMINDPLKRPSGWRDAPDPLMPDPFESCEVMPEYPELSPHQIVFMPQLQSHSEVPHVDNSDPASLVMEVSGLSDDFLARFSDDSRTIRDPTLLDKNVQFDEDFKLNANRPRGSHCESYSCMSDSSMQLSADSLVVQHSKLLAEDPTGSLPTGSLDTVSEGHGEQLLEERASNIEKTISFDGLFPYWFDPGGMMKTDSKKVDCVVSMGKLHKATDAGPQDFGVVWPVGKVRLGWDFCAFLCLLFELWVTPFDLVFLGEVEDTHMLVHISYAITTFFCLDILLNFNTGFIEGDRTIMRRREIVKHYLKFWFWVDLVATVPIDLIASAIDGGVFSMARMGKASKIMKTFRYLKMIRAMRLVRTIQQAGNVQNHFQILTPLRILLKPLQIFTFLLLFAHVHGCLYASLRRDWAETKLLSSAIRKYYHSFWWSFVGVLGNSISAEEHSTSCSADNADGRSNVAVETLGMILALERLALGVFAIREIIFYSLRFIDESKKAHLKDVVLQYLREHKVSFRTQLQVLFSLKDFGDADSRRRPWKELLSKDLPHEVRRTICDELWSQRLMTLGLIAKISEWHTEFIHELAQLVHEEVFASRAVIFLEGDAASAAYLIMSGELLVVHDNPDKHVTIPNFTKGMWVGENALVSTVLRCSATIATVHITSLMKVGGDSFQTLISQLGLMEAFQLFCSNHLWRGLCGRCGVLGNHFSDSCGVNHRRRFSLESFEERVVNKSSSLTGKVSSGGSQQNASNLVGRDLRRFIADASLGWIMPTLQLIDVSNLDDLENISQEKWERIVTTLDLAHSDIEALSSGAIKKFRAKNARRTQRTLFHHINRLHHLIFLSHYKLEAGTEAALMRSELERALQQDAGSLGHNFDEPVFLDSENLNSLEDLAERVRNTHNLVLLLTKDVLTRPWVLIEIITAKRVGVRVLLINISKQGSIFNFPDDAWFEKLRSGEFLDSDAENVLRSVNCTLEELEEALREVFMQIAVPYSPHKAQTIRFAEIAAVLKQCRLKSEGRAPRRDLAKEQLEAEKKTLRRIEEGPTDLGSPLGSIDSNFIN